MSLASSTSSQPLDPVKGCVAFVAGSGPSEAWVDFLSSSVQSTSIRFLGPDSCRPRPTFQFASKLTGLRGDVLLGRLNRYGRTSILSCQAAWLPDPWLPLTQDSARIAHKAKRPFALTVWENTLTRHPSHLVPTWRFRTIRVLREASVIHCVTSRAVDYVTRLASEVTPRVVQVYPGVDLEVFRPTPSSQPRDLHRLIFVGRLVPEKGIHELLAAFRRLRATSGTTELWVVGTGPLMPVVQAAAAQIGGLRILGSVRRNKLPAMLQACHTLVLPSKQRWLGPFLVWEEQFGFVLVEAMACGLDTIATQCGSIPEVVGEVGRLVGLDNLEENLFLALSESIKSHETWVHESRRARARAQDLFDGKRNADRLLLRVHSALTVR